MCPHVTIVGAGPGASDLITLRGRNALRQADVVLYAGSLVSPEQLGVCPPHCRLYDSARLTLEEQVALMAEAARAGQRVVRLHTGDPAMYGATNEQATALAREGIGVRVVPGVSSVFAAAAALGCELTSPEICQSVVLTRTPGRTPMPAGEDAAAFARTGATLVFFLSAGRIDSLMRHLMEEGGLAPDTPAALAYRVSWPEERILRGTVGDLARRAQEAGIGRQALILVGRALGDMAADDGDHAVSRLYDSHFSHGYRNTLPHEAFAGACALYAFTRRGLACALSLAAGLGLPCRLYATLPPEDVAAVPVADMSDLSLPPVLPLDGPELDAQLARGWQAFAAHIFVGATGIAVRKIAPLLRDKTCDPAVICVSESGAHVISLASGHLGGANRLARRAARITGGQAVISTATDLNGLPAFDELAALTRARLLNADAVRPLHAALLRGLPVDFCGPEEIFAAHLAALPNLRRIDRPEAATAEQAVIWCETDGAALRRRCPARHVLVAESRCLVLGLGCRRGLSPEELVRLAEEFLERQAGGIRPGQIACLASCALKRDEPALAALARRWGVPLRFFETTALAAVPVPTPSATVRERAGTPSVCEAAALLAARDGGDLPPRLLCPKWKAESATFALAGIPHGRRLPAEASR